MELTISAEIERKRRKRRSPSGGWLLRVLRMTSTIKKLMLLA